MYAVKRANQHTNHFGLKIIHMHTLWNTESRHSARWYLHLTFCLIVTYFHIPPLSWYYIHFRLQQKWTNCRQYDCVQNDLGSPENNEKKTTTTKIRRKKIANANEQTQKRFDAKHVFTIQMIYNLNLNMRLYLDSSNWELLFNRSLNRKHHRLFDDTPYRTLYSLSTTIAASIFCSICLHLCFVFALVISPSPPP